MDDRGWNLTPRQSFNSRRRSAKRVRSLAATSFFDEGFVHASAIRNDQTGAAGVKADDGEAVALHFAGEDGLGPTAEYALAQPVGRVLEPLDVRLA